MYFGHFDDKLIPLDLDPASPYLHGWEQWGSVVVKVVSGIDATTLSYLQRETELLSEFDTPFFPRLYFAETFTENPLTEDALPERLYVTVEEHVESTPLSACQSQYKAEAAVVKLLQRLCVGLSTLWHHEKRLVHRDLKPDNILVKPDGQVAVIDLGIVRETGAPGLTHTASPYGPMSPAYAAPEQVEYDKHSISFKTDFFALGIIAYQLLTGRNPFMASANSSVHEVMHNVLTHDPPSLESLGFATPAFSAVIERMLEKQPYRRFRTPDQLLEALNSIEVHA